MGNERRMKKLHITEAKAISQRIGADAVVVLAFRDGVVSGASYGQTKAQCDVAGYWMGCLIDDMEAGYVVPPQFGKV
jgi:hypothetical protein